MIPCGAVPKNEDPLGRIIHNYSSPSADKGSVNSALLNTSVQYISFVERTKQLSMVNWFVKVDLKNGYRQLGVHPSEWFTQVYSLGKNEFYIDLNMPFGKSNSSKIFCRWTTAWCKAFSKHFYEKFKILPILESYVDDFFGGPKKSASSLMADKMKAQVMFD